MFGKRDAPVTTTLNALNVCGHAKTSLVVDGASSICRECEWELLPMQGKELMVQFDPSTEMRQHLIFAHKTECRTDPERGDLLLPAPRMAMGMYGLGEDINWEMEKTIDSPLTLAGAVDFLEALYGRGVAHYGHTQTAGQIFTGLKRKFLAPDRIVYIQILRDGLERKLAEEFNDGSIRLSSAMTHSLAAKGFYAAKIEYKPQYNKQNQELTWLETLHEEPDVFRLTDPKYELLLTPYS